MSQKNKGHGNHPQMHHGSFPAGSQHHSQAAYRGGHSQSFPKQHTGGRQHRYDPMEDDQADIYGKGGNYVHYGHQQGGHGGHMTQAQRQEQTQRSLQASKQMLFGVYENVISQLEELEAREQGQHSQMPRSAIFMPDQSWKQHHDIRRLVEAQLLMFETQMKNCPERVREEAKDQLIATTKGWMASRVDHQTQKSDVDIFAGQLMEILKKGATKHPDDFYSMPAMSREELQPAVEAIMHGNTRKAALDQEFRDNPNKTASLTRIRSGRKATEGAERLIEAKPDLQEHMEEETENIL